MNKDPMVVTISLAGINGNAAKLLLRARKRMRDAGCTPEAVAEFDCAAQADLVLATPTRDDRHRRNYKRVLSAVKTYCEIDD